MNQINLTLVSRSIRWSTAMIAMSLLAIASSVAYASDVLPTTQVVPQHSGLLFSAERGTQRLYFIAAMHHRPHGMKLPTHFEAALKETDLILHERHDFSAQAPLAWIDEYLALPTFDKPVQPYEISDSARAFMREITNFSDSAWRVFSSSHPLSMQRTLRSMKSMTGQKRPAVRQALRTPDLEYALVEHAVKLNKRTATVEPTWGGLRFWTRDCGDPTISAIWLDLQISVFKNESQIARNEQKLSAAITEGNLRLLWELEQERNNIAMDHSILMTCVGNNRNLAWMKQIEAELSEMKYTNILLVAGASHFLSANQPSKTILGLAQQAGFTLTRICRLEKSTFKYTDAASIPDCTEQ